MTSIQQTLAGLRSLRCSGMADAYDQQLNQPNIWLNQSFDDRISALVEQELSTREHRRLRRLITNARFPESAHLEDFDTRAKRGINESLLASLATCEWVKRQQNLFIIGATGLGKSWLGIALSMEVCRKGLPAIYVSSSELWYDIATAAADGSLAQLKARLQQPALLMIDDLGSGKIPVQAAQVLLEVLDRRVRTGSILITSQYPVDHWHGLFPDPTMADAILDRIVHQAHRIELKGESMRKVYARKRMQAT